MLSSKQRLAQPHGSADNLAWRTFNVKIGNEPLLQTCYLLTPTGFRGGGGIECSSGTKVAADDLMRVTANESQPLLLGARRQLRREIIDICFR